MPSNLILGRVTEFLESYSPFDLVEESLVGKMAAAVEIRYFDDGETLFQEGDIPGKYCYMIRKGRVNLLKRLRGDNQLVDVCGEGDLFGIRSMLSGENYKLSALVEKEALVYLIPSALMQSFVKENPAVSQFFAIGLASGQVVMGHKNKISVSNYLQNWQFSDQLDQLLPPSYQKELITCHPEESIKNASEKMASKNAGSIIIVNKSQMPIGIITDTDLRNQVATGKVKVEQPVKSIMSSPVITLSPEQNTGEIIVKMMNSGVHHLCITEDGTSQSRILGIISNHDILMLKGSSPTVILKAIKKAKGLNELKILFSESENITRRYMVHDVPLHIIREVTSNIQETVTKIAIELVAGESPRPDDLNYCWVDLGSSARKERYLKTDLDNLLIFSKEPDNNSMKDILVELAGKVNHFLVDCGYSLCQAGIMGHLSSMCLDERQWEDRFKGWIYQPDPEALLKATIFFDMRAMYGNVEMVKRLKEAIIRYIKEQPSFLNFLARNATQNPPPLSFFNQFIVESSGEHKNEFDIKKRAIMPMVDAARVLALDHYFYESVGTIERFRYVGQQEPQNKSILEEAIQGYEFILKMRTKSGYFHRDDGRFVDISSFSKIEKKVLKEIFQVIREIQKIIRVRFQLEYFH